MVVANAAGVRVVVLVNGQSFLHMLHLVLQLEIPSPQLLDLKVGLGRGIEMLELAGDSSSALLYHSHLLLKIVYLIIKF
jgi:hypothetical protein